jgi:hypothetical protein
VNVNHPLHVLESWNWWSPAPLRRLYERLKLDEERGSADALHARAALSH